MLGADMEPSYSFQGADQRSHFQEIGFEIFEVGEMVEADLERTVEAYSWSHLVFVASSPI